MIERWQLAQRQSIPLEGKILFSRKRIQEFYEKMQGKVCISFSGGKDSTVLLHLVRSLYPEVPAVFSDTGLEYPELKEFVKTFENIHVVRPQMSFRQVLDTYGYPVVSKRVAKMIRVIRNPSENNEASRTLYLTGVKRDGSKTKHFKLAAKWRFLLGAPFKISDECCDVMKKQPLHSWQREHGLVPYIGTMASEGGNREASYLQTGCNVFTKKKEHSMPLAIWTETDIWEYIKKFNLPYCSVYDTGVSRTGCIFCLFGLDREKKGQTRFDHLQRTHPLLYKYCMTELGLKPIIDFLTARGRPFQTPLFSEGDNNV